MKQLLPMFPLPPPPETTSLCFVSMDVPILHISEKWNHTICDLVCLTFSPVHI